MQWNAILTLPKNSTLPLFLQVVQCVSDAISRKRLVAGDRLPGSRALATSLGVHRNTVLSAYDELQAQGWIEARGAQGTFVASDIPFPITAKAPTPVGRSATVSYPLAPIPGVKHLSLPSTHLHLAGGQPDLRLVPCLELGRSWRRAISRRGQVLLGYGHPQGLLEMRRALSQMLRARRNLVASPDEIIITRGAQMGLALAARVLLSPGQVVAVEAFGYSAAWNAFRAAGASLEPVAIDQQGLVVEDLERLLEQTPIRALYLTPHHQYPTMATLSAGRRMRLLELARKHRFAILEDDYDHEFHYDGQPVFPLSSADHEGSSLYVGSLSKILAPGLRLGYVVAPQPVIESMVHARTLMDRQGAQVTEAAIAQWMEEGLLERHIRRVRRHYHERRDHLIERLKHEFGDGLEVKTPAGGLALWVRDTVHDTTSLWARRALEEGVLVRPQELYSFDRSPGPFMRLGFAALTPEELTLAVSRLRQVWG